MASPFVSTLISYNAPGAKGSRVVGATGFTAIDGCTLKMMIDLLRSPGLLKAYRSVMSNRASPRGNPKSGPEAWCDIVHPRFFRRSAPDLADVISQAVFHVTRLVKSPLH